MKKLIDETLSFEIADFLNESHCRSIVNLIRAYMADPMGDAKAPDNSFDQKLIEGLKNQSSCYILFAILGNQAVGMATCFVNFSTFKATPYTNVHDIIVLEKYRGQGIGRALLEDVIVRAYQNNHCKVTLEVRDDNLVAQKLYKDLGFDQCQPPMWFWVKYL